MGILLVLMVGKEQKVSFYCMVNRRWEDPNVQMIDDVHGCSRVVVWWQSRDEAVGVG